jgi:hypothetical protein
MRKIITLKVVAKDSLTKEVTNSTLKIKSKKIPSKDNNLLFKDKE